MALDDAVTYLQQQAATIAGIRLAPAKPTDQVGALPAVFSYVATLDESTKPSAANIIELHTIRTEIHAALVDLPRVVVYLQPLWEQFTSKVWADASLGGRVEHVNSIRGAINGAASWGGVKTVALEFLIQVKTRRSA